MSHFAVLADTSKNDELLEVYTNDIFYYADEYINNNISDSNDRNEIRENFDNIIFYIRHRIQKPDNNNIQLLDELFYVFLELCVKCYVVPTLENFGLMFSISPSTFSDWINGDYRYSTPIYSKTAKKWRDICKSRLVNILTQSKGGDINRIFIAKAAYGMVETAPIPTVNKYAPVLDNTQLAARLGDRLETVEAEAIEDQELNTKSEG